MTLAELMKRDAEVQRRRAESDTLEVLENWVKRCRNGRTFWRIENNSK